MSVREKFKSSEKHFMRVNQFLNFHVAEIEPSPPGSNLTS